MKSDELQHCFKVKMTQKYMFYLKYNHTNWKSNIANIRYDPLYIYYLIKSQPDPSSQNEVNFQKKKIEVRI